MNEPLKNLTETFNIDTIKGYFPHHFNRPENQNYIGKIPSEEAYGVKNMMPKAYEEIVRWPAWKPKTHVSTSAATYIHRNCSSLCSV